MQKPVKRTPLRIFVGMQYYKFKRYLIWYLSVYKWARTYRDEELDYIAFLHKTPLIRKLKSVDMWMQYNKITNLKIATSILNGITVYPGETLSFWRLLGKPSSQKGYVEGMVLSNGRVQAGIGGGLCQLSNLIYWMTLHTPLTVTERYRHSYDVFPDNDRSLPFGSGATCAYNYIDLQIHNNTDQPYQLLVYLTDKHLAGEWKTDRKPEYTYEVYEKEHWITQEYWGGHVRHNIIHRRVYNNNGELIDDEYITENHAIMMYQPFLQESNQSSKVS